MTMRNYVLKNPYILFGDLIFAGMTLILMQILETQQPLVVYFPDSSLWLSRAVSKSDRKEFVSKMQEMFDKLSGPLVLICGQNKIEAESNSKEKDKFVSSNM